MAYLLFISSGVDVSFDPEYDFSNALIKKESRQRTPSGREYVYKWGDFRQWKFTVNYVNSNFMSIVNSWYSQNTELLFMKEGETQVYSVRLLGSESPITEFVMPYDNLFVGEIELGTY